jgi:hypothetical protein
MEQVRFAKIAIGLNLWSLLNDTSPKGDYLEFYSSFNSIKTKYRWKTVAKDYNDLCKYTKI